MKLPQTNFRSLPWVGRAYTRAVKTRLAAYGVCRTVGQAAFTMVEVALALAVIAFALVAIIGILPSGMTVQKENREETIINQDAMVLLEAIRSGAKGMDDLTNYVIAITNYWTLYDERTNVQRSGYDGYDFNGSRITSITPAPFLPLTNGYRIVGLLSTPRFTPAPSPSAPAPSQGSGWFYGNQVEAYGRALSGTAVDKYPQANLTIREGAFSYKVIPEVVPYDRYAVLGKDQYRDPVLGVLFRTNMISRTLEGNLHALSLTFRWPLLPNGRTGFGRQTFRTVAGGWVVTNDIPFYFIEPGTYAPAP